MHINSYKYSHIPQLVPLLLFLFFSSQLFGQSGVRTYDIYIDKYSDLAIEHMERYSIPASITLAQGILESGAGMSDWRRSNNHFGIKCHRGWNGSKGFCCRRYAKRLLQKL